MIASFLVVTIGYPIVVDQGWLRYNVYVLPCILIGSAILYSVLFIHGGWFKLRSSKFKAAHGVFVGLLTFILLFGLVGVAYGIGFYYSLKVSKEHIAAMLEREHPPSKPEKPREVSHEVPHNETPHKAQPSPPKPTHKVPPPSSPLVEPAPKAPPRLGIGAEAYKDIEDVQLAQWARDESYKIEEMANGAMRPGLESPRAAQWFFSNNIKQCCVQDVQELRTEILRRLGPPGKDPDEISAWTILFPQTHFQGASDTITPRSASNYAPYLRRLASRLKRRQIPRVGAISLHFSEAQVPPQPPLNSPYNLMATIKTETKVTAGYIIVEFDHHPGTIVCDFEDSKLVLTSDGRLIDNEEVRNYAGKYEPPNYALVIGKTPFTPEKPIRVLASGAEPLRVVKVTLYDE